MNIQERLLDVENRVIEACLRSERVGHDVNIVAVTKSCNIETTERVLQQGLVHIGENRWQDAEEKWEALGHVGSWHFIGHLQTNKVRNIVGKFTYIHSLDRISLAKEIEKRAAALNIQVRCFIQVNISGESSKYGLEPEQLFSFVEQIRDFKHIEVIGLMTMAPYELEPEETRPIFQGLRLLRDELNERAIYEEQIPHLSMGMSNDFGVAIEEGATWIRLGTILVGD